MKKYILITSFIFVLVLGGAFMFASKNVGAVTDTPVLTAGPQYVAAWTSVNATKYTARFYNCTNITSPVLLTTVTSTSPSYNFTNFVTDPNVKYCYDVKATNYFGDSASSLITPISPREAPPLKATVAVLTSFTGYNFKATTDAFAKFDAVAKAKALAETAVSAADTKNKAYVTAVKAVITTGKAFDLGSTVARTTALRTAYNNYKAKAKAADVAVEKAKTALEALDKTMAVLTGQTSSGDGTVTLNSETQTVTITNGTSVFSLITREKECRPVLPGCTSSIDSVLSYLSEASINALGIAGTGGMAYSSVTVHCTNLNGAGYTTTGDSGNPAAACEANRFDYIVN